MERELWVEVSRAVDEVDAGWREPAAFVHATALVARVHLWAALHDRPVSWACRPKSWAALPPRCRPAALPDQSTASRRARRPGPGSLDEFLAAVADRLAGGPAAGPLGGLVARFDGKSLEVAAHSTDRQATWGRAAGRLGRGYKLHALWAAARPFPVAWAVAPLNVDETRMLARFLTRGGAGGGGYVLADTRLDSGPLHARAAAANYQLVAPRPNARGSDRPGRGFGHRKACRHPARVRSAALLEPPPVPAVSNGFGRSLFRQRGQVERDFGNLCAFGGGLSGLPAWVRRPWRVRRWVHLKLLINAARINCRRAARA